MKTLKIYSILSAILAISLFSCDIVEEPFMIVQEEVSDSCEAFIFSPIENPIKKVLLEDYTGHQCGNCPRAAEKAVELQGIYGDQLVVMAVHAGFFASTSSSYPTDFTTEAGDDWDTHFGNSNAGNPNGQIDRVNFPNGHIYQYTEWGQIIDEQLQDEAKIGIQIIATHNEAANLICIDTQTEVYQTIDHELNITVVVLENGLISKQTDYSAPSQYVENYEQNHVLRKSLNGSWGENLGQESYEEQDFIINRYSTEVSSDWTIENILVVAFVSHPETYEVLQVEEVHITE